MCFFSHDEEKGGVQGLLGRALILTVAVEKRGRQLTRWGGGDGGVTRRNGEREGQQRGGMEKGRGSREEEWRKGGATERRNGEREGQQRGGMEKGRGNKGCNEKNVNHYVVCFAYSLV